jgi:N-acetylated-alpha-linked acidic dipeptidase
LTGRKKSGQAWFWHTEHDTLDKVDLDVLETDTRIYLATIVRLLNPPVLPFDYVATVDELLDALTTYQTEASDAVDLRAAVERARQLRDLLVEFNRRAATVSGEDEIDIVNQTLIDLGRMLVPLNYTGSGQFEHDLALHAPAIPALHEIHRLATLDPESDEYRFLRAKLTRRRNQVAFTLRQAVEHVDAAFDLLDTVEGGS